MQKIAEQPLRPPRIFATIGIESFMREHRKKRKRKEALSMNDELTAQDIQKMQAELDDRRLRLMPELIEEVKRTRAFGDLSENSEYDEAKSEQGKLYSKIAEIKNLIENAEIVDKNEGNTNKGAVTLGSVVKVKDADGDVEEYTVVGSQEANPMEGMISDDSPFGRGLYGHVAGDTVEVEAPIGTLKYTIVSVENN